VSAPCVTLPRPHRLGQEHGCGPSRACDAVLGRASFHGALGWPPTRGA